MSKYYVGYTSMMISERLRRHNSNHKGFTGRADDWVVVYEKEIKDKDSAVQLEKKIKSRGAKRYLEDQAK